MKCRHCGAAIKPLPNGCWSDEAGFMVCVKAPLSSVGHGVPASFVLHQPMPAGLDGGPS
jgi:hypothetical protein